MCPKGFKLLVYTSMLTTLCSLLHVTSQSIVPSTDTDYDSDDDDATNITETTTVTAKDDMPRFTYADNDALGPLQWRNRDLAYRQLNPFPTEKSWQRAVLKHEQSHGDMKPKTIPPKLEKLYTESFCQTNWLSPINIETNRVHTPELKVKEKKELKLAGETARMPETLNLLIRHPNIQHSVWFFGHPSKYHGIEIRPRALDHVYLMDNFDPLGNTESFTKYDFNFLTLYYCDLRRAPKHRTMHQIDGKRFPLELQFVFLRTIRPAEIRRFFPDAQEDFDDVDLEKDLMQSLYNGDQVAVIVAVIAEIAPDNNRFLEPVIKAAQEFHGKDWKSDHFDDELNTVELDTPWSPTWLLPDSSDYYYYNDASFPVPPCWKVARYYILRERITISQEQLEVLTHIKTDREKSSRRQLPCTHSISLVHNDTLLEGETPVYLNPIEYELQGEDGKPRTQEEIRLRKERRRKRERFRKRLTGNVVKLREGTVFVEEEDEAGAGSSAMAIKIKTPKEAKRHSYFVLFVVVMMHLVMFWWSFAFYFF